MVVTLIFKHDCFYKYTLLILIVFLVLYYLVNKIKTYKKRKRTRERSKMTKELRKEVLKRDGYKCRKCGVSIKDEPHLLLEIDHIKPISKGGKTVKRNLQTLCWKCNRRKNTNNKKY